MSFIYCYKCLSTSGILMLQYTNVLQKFINFCSTLGKGPVVVINVNGWDALHNFGSFKNLSIKGLFTPQKIIVSCNIFSDFLVMIKTIIRTYLPKMPASNLCNRSLFQIYFGSKNTFFTD